MQKPHLLTTMKHRSVMAIAVAVSGGIVLASSGSAPVSAMSASDDTMHHTSTSQGSDMHMATGESNSQAATDLRVAMNNLLSQHVTVSLDATRSIVDITSQRQIDAAVESQNLNADDLAAAVGSVYGSEAQAQFSELFKEHITESNNYAMAVGEHDDAARQAALEELQTYLVDLSNFFSTAIPGLPQQDVYGLLNEHEELINKSTEAYKAGDFVQSYQLEREALKQVTRIADALSGGIIATQPDKF